MAFYAYITKVRQKPLRSSTLGHSQGWPLSPGVRREGGALHRPEPAGPAKLSTALRLYEQDRSESCDSPRLEAYVRRWCGWARAGALGVRVPGGSGLGAPRLVAV